MTTTSTADTWTPLATINLAVIAAFGLVIASTGVKPSS